MHVLVADVLNAQFLLEHFHGVSFDLILDSSADLTHLLKSVDLPVCIFCHLVEDALLCRLWSLENPVVDVGLSAVKVFKVLL